MDFLTFKKDILFQAANLKFEDASKYFEDVIFGLSQEEFLPLVVDIGTIPENIAHDSSEEKLYTKIGDIVLAKCFQELGLSSEVIKKRVNCADVVAKSKFHSYSLVGDAKTFRLSRTAKNQKDFKVQSMQHWRGDHDFAVLSSPFFQYPRSRSQIYTQALDGNILLFSWEYFAFLLENNICETETFSLKPIWNLSQQIAGMFSRAEQEIIFWDKQDKILCNYLELSENALADSLKKSQQSTIERGNTEIEDCQKAISQIRTYSREEAIEELIKARKLNEKIAAIQSYIKYLGEL